ncbi:zf-CCHC domain-containing protein [Tanacetum coccineum]
MYLAFSSKSYLERGAQDPNNNHPLVELERAGSEEVHTQNKKVDADKSTSDLDYSSKNHVRKFLRALPLKWKAKVTAIEESKDLVTLPLDEIVGNLKVYEMILENDSVVSKTTTKDKVKSLTLKAKVTREQTSDDSDSQDGSDEDEKKAFVGGAWSDSEDGDEHQNDAKSLMAIDSQEVCLKCDLRLDDWIVDSGCTKHMTGNRRFFTSYKAYDGGHVIFGSNLKGKVVGGVLNKETMRIEESLNVTFDESLPEPKSSSLVEDDRIIEPVVQNPVKSSSLQVNASESGYPKNLKEARGCNISQFQVSPPRTPGQ